jgi:NAD(P)H-flavin reductase
LWTFGSEPVPGPAELEGNDADSNYTLDVEEEQPDEEDAAMGRPMHAILDGPYGGPTCDAGAYGRVLFVSGGSGVTATLGLLDDLVGRCVRRTRATGERTKHIEWVWCVRSAGV